MEVPKRDDGDAVSHISHHRLHTGRRIRAFFRPNGRKVHIASSPVEMDQLKLTLSRTEKDEFEVVIHGSEEHIEALRESHRHTEEHINELRAKYGHAFEEFERVVRQMDELSAELHNVSDHAVQLDANFSKYGYSAHLRTKGNEEPSSATSLYGETLDDIHHDWDAERHQGQAMQFWVKPIVRQYFHKGLLWRAQEAQEVASYELFIDLLYVGIIAISGDNAAEVGTGEALVRFAVTFILSWKFWSDISTIIGWFDADDMFRRLTVLFILTCLLGFTTNMVASQETTYAALISFYLASRLFLAVYFVWHACLIPMVLPVMLGNAIVMALPAAVWIGSIHVDIPNRYALIWIGIALDLFGPMLLTMFHRGKLFPFSKRFVKFAKETFEFTPGVSIEHKIERTNAFVTLVFGYSVVALLYQNARTFALNAFFGKAVLGLIQAFAFNWLYFEIDSFNLHVHAIRRHIFSAATWITIHLPFIMAYVISGAVLSKLVLAHDCKDADPEALVESFAAKSADRIYDGQRWFYCAGLGISLACMGVISLTHVYKTIPGQRFVKSKRLAVRFVASIVLILLPLAKSLNSLQLIATTTSIVVLVLIFELVGSTRVGENFWWNLERHCTYNANCRVTNKELQASMKDGTVINVEEISKREKWVKHSLTM